MNAIRITSLPDVAAFPPPRGKCSIALQLSTRSTVVSRALSPHHEPWLSQQKDDSLTEHFGPLFISSPMLWVYILSWNTGGKHLKCLAGNWGHWNRKYSQTEACGKKHLAQRQTLPFHTCLAKDKLRVQTFVFPSPSPWLYCSVGNIPKPCSTAASCHGPCGTVRWHKPQETSFLKSCINQTLPHFSIF